MKRSKESAFKSMSVELGKLKTELEQAKQKNGLLQEEIKQRSKGMTTTFDAVKHAKQIKIIQHIAAGRATEAITELLEPVPLVINIEIKFADDKTRLAAEQEVAEKAKATLIEAIQNTSVGPTRKES